jgi:hypothetical protein
VFYSFGRDLVSPGQHERDGKTNSQRKNYQSRPPVRDLENRKNLGRNLDEQPTYDSVSDGDAVDIPALELGEKFFKIHCIFREGRK